MPELSSLQLPDMSNIRFSTAPTVDSYFNLNYDTSGLANIANLSLYRTGQVLSKSEDALTLLLGKLMMDDSLKFDTSFMDFSFKKPNGTSFTPTSLGGNNANQTGLLFNIMGSTMNALTPERNEAFGEYGNYYNGATQAYESTNAAVDKFSPAVGGLMRLSGASGKAMNKIIGDTDGVTKTDAVMASPWFSWNAGLINSAFKKRSNKLLYDPDTWAKSMASYSGSYTDYMNARKKANKQVGIASNIRKVNSQVGEGNRIYELVKDITDASEDQRTSALTMSGINAINYDNTISKDKYTYAAKNGGVLERARAILAKKGTKVPEEIVPLVDSYEFFLNSLPINLLKNDMYRMEDYWKYNSKPKDFFEALLKNMFTLLGDGWHAYSLAKNPETGEIEFMKAYNHPTIQLELDAYNSPENEEFRNNYELVKTEPYYKYVRRKKVARHENGGSLIEITIPVQEFKDGGPVNVIPEGALHAHKHNMDMDGITKKGIPVVDLDGTQQAEIERSEIILIKSVTTKLEELEKVYSNEESSLKEKDEAALEAGKLLVDLIMNNTIDNTKELL